MELQQQDSLTDPQLTGSVCVPFTLTQRYFILPVGGGDLIFNDKLSQCFILLDKLQQKYFLKDVEVLPFSFQPLGFLFIKVTMCHYSSMDKLASIINNIRGENITKVHIEPQCI